MGQGLAGAVSGQKQPTATTWADRHQRPRRDPPGMEASLQLWAGGATSAGFQVSLTCLLCAPRPVCCGSVPCA